MRVDRTGEITASLCSSAKKGGCAMKTQDQSIQEQLPEQIPIVPTMDVVVFPHMIVPLLVLDEKIIEGINQALDTENKTVLLVASKQGENKDNAISTSDLYTVGTVASIMRVINVPEGGIKILVQGMCKADIKDIHTNNNLYASIDPRTFTPDDNSHIDQQVKQLKEIGEQMANAGQAPTPDFHVILSKMQDPEKIADFVLSHVNLSVEQAQSLLEAQDYASFLEGLAQALIRGVEVSEVNERVRNHARESMNQAQKEFYLREQLKAIKKELGEDDAEEAEKYRELLDQLSLDEESYNEVKRQIGRLEKISAESMEAAVIRNYLDWVTSLPWNTMTEDNLDINHAREVLDEDHAGLEKIKERILDFISVRSLKHDSSTPILCFAGPPGVGKTSLGKSVARALNRQYYRVSLGGIRDEAEIRGHRRTYVGSMPGRFIQAIRKTETKNPVVVIDEIDKVGSDFRGDPSSALLEVLDPQQNATFYDNYLNVPFNLSHTIFIATANNLEDIPPALRDRMEIIQLHGYTWEEKLNITKDYLLPNALQDAGLKDNNVTIREDVITKLIHEYTREPGVREVERLCKKVYSKVARSLVEHNQILEIDPDNLETYLGPPPFKSEEHDSENQVGITNGLAWTSCGGEIIKIEAVIMPGKGNLYLTGQLGDIMKESAHAALSYARSHADTFEIDPKVFTDYDLHIHAPAGSVPKDGPSAGVTMLSSILSALTQRPISSEYAMTGEINLRGNVMPIGGVKEKLLAARRNKIPRVILPARNKKDMQECENMADDVEIIWVDHADEILERVLLPHSK